MNIEDLTIRDAKALAAMFGGAACPSARQHGKCIVIADRGWVWVGDCEERDGYMIVTNASNIHAWGTTKGLGELVTGPLPKTRCDPVGTLKVSLRAVIGLIPVEADKWSE